MADIFIRQCSKEDEKDILNICYRTGYMGEDLTALDKFNDHKLFGYLFCLYYPRYEPEHCFVAVDREAGDRVIGYILGTDNTTRQIIRFTLSHGWRIVLRMFLCTLWKYPESFRAVFYFIFNATPEGEPRGLSRSYPAHLHINVLPEYQRSGAGSRLIEAFEAHMAQKRVRGIHLRTSNKNTKAVSFYEKKGYDIISESSNRVWRSVSNYRSLIFAKKLE